MWCGSDPCTAQKCLTIARLQACGVCMYVCVYELLVSTTHVLVCRKVVLSSAAIWLSGFKQQLTQCSNKLQQRSSLLQLWQVYCRPLVQQPVD